MLVSVVKNLYQMVDQMAVMAEKAATSFLKWMKD